MRSVHGCMAIVHGRGLCEDPMPFAWSMCAACFCSNIGIPHYLGVPHPKLERWLDIQRIQKQTGILVDKSPGHLWRDKWAALSGPLSRTEDAGCTSNQVTSQNFKRNASRLKVLRGTHDTFVRSATSNFWRVFRARIDFTRRCDALS